MLCKNCNSVIPDNARFCDSCGAAVAAAAPEVTPVAAPVIPVIPVPVKPEIPDEYKPLSAWAYFGLQLLYAIPVIGFIFLIIFTFNGGNVHRRSFTRSYWCALLIFAPIIIIALIIMLSSGGSYYYYYY